MFTCYEIETTGYTPRQLLELFVMEKRAETNLTQIQGIDADGDDGIWSRFKKGYEKNNDVNFSWFAKDGTLATAGTFPRIAYGTTKTIAEFATHTGIAIDNQTGITDALYWTGNDALDLKSDYFFTVLTPDGLTLVLPEATGTFRGNLNKDNCVLRVLSDKIINYAGESTGDVFIANGGDVQPVLITDTYKQLAVNKANAAANYIVFSAVKIYVVGDWVCDWDGNKYVIMSGRKVDTDVWHYTAVKEYIDSGAFAGADVTPIIPLNSVPGISYEYTSSSGVVISTPSKNTWYNPASHSIANVPAGVWFYEYFVIVNPYWASAPSTAPSRIEAFATLSNANNTEIVANSSRFLLINTTNIWSQGYFPLTKSGYITLTATTTLYLNIKGNFSGETGGTFGLATAGASGQTFIRLTRIS